MGIFKKKMKLHLVIFTLVLTSSQLVSIISANQPPSPPLRSNSKDLSEKNNDALTNFNQKEKSFDLDSYGVVNKDDQQLITDTPVTKNDLGIKGENMIDLA